MKPNKEHWENIYQNKQPDEVSWTQETPQISLDFIHALNLPKSSSIIDVGGGESRLAACLLNEGYNNITVLDISSNAIEKAKKRMGNNADKITWIVSDILEFKPGKTYDCWHDRATFHFLTEENEIQKYVELVSFCVNKFLVIGTFATDGPTKCSGLEIKQYNEVAMEQKFSTHFKQMPCLREMHVTPFNTQQNFIFCSFEKTHRP
jgi:trans-aconitate methyltransferase